MQIVIKKISHYKAEYSIYRKDKTKERIVLDTKTYFVHDTCHFVVEKHLGYKTGFWGMLAQGYAFESLLGKAIL